MEFFFHLNTASSIYNEEQARQWRYLEMIKLADQINSDYILTAHTLTDKIETILYNIMKGSGLEGSVAMQYYNIVNNKITLLHPIIDLLREETLWFCKQFYIPIWSDTTNYEYKILRNRIRQELIPYCKNYFNHNFEKSITKFIFNITKDLEYIQQQAYYIYLKYRHPHFIGFNKEIFLLLPNNMKRRILRILIYHQTNSKITFKQTNWIVNFILNSTYKYQAIYPKWYIYLSNKWIYLVQH